LSDGVVVAVAYSPNSSGQQSGVWQWVNSSKRGSAASREGTQNRGLEYFTRGGEEPGDIQTIDPRVPVRGPDVGIGTTNPAYLPLHLETGGADIVLAGWVEARLIGAEALRSDGGSAAYLTILNALRANVADIIPGLGLREDPDATLVPLPDPGTREGRIRQLFGERAKWMWFTGHRLGD